MGILLNDGLKINAGKPIDSKYLASTNQPYGSVSAVLSAIPEALRYVGLTVNVNNIEYWFCNGVADSDLVIKDSGIASVGITKAINGLTKVSDAVRLGGTLTGSTIITDSRGTPVGIEYGGDYSTNYTARSIVDAGYVTGKTNAISINLANNYYDKTQINYYTGTTVPNNYYNKTQINYYTGSTVPNNYYNKTQINYYTGSTVPNNYYNKTQINYYTGSTDNRITLLELNSAKAITGATNGLTSSPSRLVCLGGTLNMNTIISGANCLKLGDLNSICLSTQNTTDIALNAKSNGAIYLKSQSGTIESSNDSTNAVLFSMDYNASPAMLIIDNTPSPHGLVYAGDYSQTFCPHSLVDKQYVDSVVTGLNVHGAVAVATTSEITLSGLSQTIDGVTPTVGMRILVKDQSNQTTNGIYSASTGIWGRTSDYNFAPTGEVDNGDIIPVLSGNTNANSQWILISPNPIISGTTDLVFSKFSQQQGIIDGNGISVTTVGTNRQIDVKLSSTNSGLCFDSTALELDYSIFRYGLTCSQTVGKVDVKTEYCSATGLEIPVALNTGNTSCKLYVDSCTIKTCLNPVIDVNNGLTKVGCTVSLGGTLTGDTTISGNAGAYDLNINNLDSFNLGFSNVSTITDNGTNGGLRYAADYSGDYVTRSLVDKGYVDNAIIASGSSSITASNGLTKVNNTIALGGVLTGDTSICLNGSDISFGCTSEDTYLDINGAAASIISHANFDTYFNLCGAPAQQFADLEVGANTFLYLDDTNSIAEIYTNNTYIDMCGTSGSENICMQASPDTYFNMCGISGYENIHMQASPGTYFCLCGTPALQFAELMVGTFAHLYLDGTNSNAGIYTNNTCIDMCGTSGYENIHMQVSPDTYFCLCGAPAQQFAELMVAELMVGTFAHLYLDGTNSIAEISAGNTLIGMCGASGSGCVILKVNNNADVAQICMDAAGGSECIILQVNDNADVAQICMDAAGVTIDSSVGVNLGSTTYNGQVYIKAPISAGTSNDEVIVRDSSTGELKTVLQSCLGGKNINYCVCSIAANTTFTESGNTYVILVDSSTSSICVTLPSLVFNGRTFKIKDGSGNALTNNIIICSQNNAHTFDGNTYAIINTDYGALELMYGEGAGSCEWKVISFYN